MTTLAVWATNNHIDTLCEGTSFNLRTNAYLPVQSDMNKQPTKLP